MLPGRKLLGEGRSQERDASRRGELRGEESSEEKRAPWRGELQGEESSKESQKRTTHQKKPNLPLVEAHLRSNSR
jgi:hypothetical protein